MRILQINTLLNSGSHGRIVEDIGQLIIKKGNDSYIAYGRGTQKSDSSVIKIGNSFGVYKHVVKTRIFDGHGFGSYNDTREFLRVIKIINPDIIHLHNIHGYFLNIELLFKFLAEVNKPVIWTLHDCWAFTGHCSHFEHKSCYKWKTQCFSCPNKKGYPSSWIIDNSRNNYNTKKRLFTNLESLVIASPSEWLANHVKESFLNKYPIELINNGVDLNVFTPLSDTLYIRRKYDLIDKRVILGAANIWSECKGLTDFIELSKSLSARERIVLVGLNKKQLKALPSNVKGIARTESVDELARLYNVADVFVNPTYLDNFPSTNIEALACGTPVITYQTGGSPEAVDQNTGRVLPKGDIDGIRNAIDSLGAADQGSIRSLCEERARKLYNKEDRYAEYLSLYQRLKIKDR